MFSLKNLASIQTTFFLPGFCLSLIFGFSNTPLSATASVQDSEEETRKEAAVNVHKENLNVVTHTAEATAKSFKLYLEIRPGKENRHWAAKAPFVHPFPENGHYRGYSPRKAS